MGAAGAVAAGTDLVAEDAIEVWEYDDAEYKQQHTSSSHVSEGGEKNGFI